MTNVGLGIQKALLRACELEESCPRKLMVRLMTRYGGTIANRVGVTVDGCDVPLGLLIRAHVAVSNRDELMAQHTSSAQERLIFWEDLDARAHELVDLVEQCVAAAEAAVGIVREPAGGPK